MIGPNLKFIVFVGAATTPATEPLVLVAFDWNSEVEHTLLHPTIWQVKPKKMLVRCRNPTKGSIQRDPILSTVARYGACGVGYVVSGEAIA